MLPGRADAHDGFGPNSCRPWPHLPNGTPPCRVGQVGEGVSPTLDAKRYSNYSVKFHKRCFITGIWICCHIPNCFSSDPGAKHGGNMGINPVTNSGEPVQL